MPHVVRNSLASDSHGEAGSCNMGLVARGPVTVPGTLAGVRCNQTTAREVNRAPASTYNSAPPAPASLSAPGASTDSTRGSHCMIESGTREHFPVQTPSATARHADAHHPDSTHCARPPLAMQASVSAYPRLAIEATYQNCLSSSSDDRHAAAMLRTGGRSASYVGCISGGRLVEDRCSAPQHAERILAPAEVTLLRTAEQHTALRPGERSLAPVEVTVLRTEQHAALRPGERSLAPVEVTVLRTEQHTALRPGERSLAPVEVTVLRTEQHTALRPGERSLASADVTALRADNPPLRPTERSLGPAEVTVLRTAEQHTAPMPTPMPPPPPMNMAPIMRFGGVRLKNAAKHVLVCYHIIREQRRARGEYLPGGLPVYRKESMTTAHPLAHTCDTSITACTNGRSPCSSSSFECKQGTQNAAMASACPYQVASHQVEGAFVRGSTVGPASCTGTGTGIWVSTGARPGSIDSGLTQGAIPAAGAFVDASPLSMGSRSVAVPYPTRAQCL